MYAFTRVCCKDSAKYKPVKNYGLSFRLVGLPHYSRGGGWSHIKKCFTEECVCTEICREKLLPS